MEKDCFVFWKRLFAFFIDYLLVGLIGGMLGALFFEQLYDIGNWGLLIGLAICILYFGILNSSIGKGQTIGKKILKIKVVSKDGQYLNVSKSALRSTVLSIPLLLNGTQYPVYLMNSFVVQMQSAIFVILGGGILYLFLFNKPTRQSLHDLFAQSYVVNYDCDKTDFSENKTKQIHYIIIGIITLLSFVLPISTSKLATKVAGLAEMENISKAVKQEKNVDLIGFNANYEYSTDKGNSSSLNIIARNKKIDDKNLILGIAEKVLNDYPKAKDFTLMTIVVVKNYNIGISHGEVNYTATYYPSAWLQYIQDAKREIKK